MFVFDALLWFMHTLMFEASICFLVVFQGSWFEKESKHLFGFEDVDNEDSCTSVVVVMSATRNF